LRSGNFSTVTVSMYSLDSGSALVSLDLRSSSAFCLLSMIVVSATFLTSFSGSSMVDELLQDIMAETLQGCVELNVDVEHHGEHLDRDEGV